MRRRTSQADRAGWWPGAGWAGPPDGEGDPGPDSPDRMWRGHRHPRRHAVGGWLRRRGGHGPLRRAEEDRLLGGVAAGLAVRTGFDVTLIRVIVVVTGIASGFGAAAYVMAWLLIPPASGDSSIASRALSDRRGLALAAGLASLVAVILALAGLGAGWVGPLVTPAVITVAGTALIWRNASAAEQATMRRVAEPLFGLAGSRKSSWTILRLCVSVLMLASGLTLLLAWQLNAKTLRPLTGLVLVIAAVVTMLGPWWVRIAQDLVVERQARVRAEERADVAARVHDSVLQTLALIQRRAQDPQQVIQLARAQERELRGWLFGGQVPGPADATTFAAGVRLIQQDVEAQHGMTVEAVTVGDCPLDGDGDLAALLAAAREATVNAAKWSGAPAVSVFAEVEPGQVSVFVRDRGRGFDPAGVPADRKGLAESVHGRMSRRGGSAAVRSTPGEGTEVALTMPRTPGRTHPSRA